MTKNDPKQLKTRQNDPSQVKPKRRPIVTQNKPKRPKTS